MGSTTVLHILGFDAMENQREECLARSLFQKYCECVRFMNGEVVEIYM